VEAQLRKDPELQVERVKGQLGEFRVEIEGGEDVKGSRYPRPSKIVAQVRDRLSSPK
jgi:hypothetical protein